MGIKRLCTEIIALRDFLVHAIWRAFAIFFWLRRPGLGALQFSSIFSSRLPVHTTWLDQAHWFSRSFGPLDLDLIDVHLESFWVTMDDRWMPNGSHVDAEWTAGRTLDGRASWSNGRGNGIGSPCQSGGHTRFALVMEVGLAGRLACWNNSFEMNESF